MSNLSEEEYPLLETKEMANRERELEKLNKTEIIKKLVATEETLKFYSEIITKKDKMIDLLIDDVYDNDNFWRLKCGFERIEKGKEKEYIKERFYKKVKEEK